MSTSATNDPENHLQGAANMNALVIALIVMSFLRRYLDKENRVDHLNIDTFRFAIRGTGREFLFTQLLGVFFPDEVRERIP